jgi:uncharacterized membrane protein YGL010W
MKTLIEQLGQYASYHRDRRNILTHFIGIPMIVAAVCLLLSRPAITGLPWLTPGSLVACVASLYYLRLDLRYGLVLGAYLAACLSLSRPLADGELTPWLAWGLGLFGIGWLIQFIGHYFEGRKPAFADDLMSLAIGPLFVVAEAGFLLGLRPETEAAVTARAGGTR